MLLILTEILHTGQRQKSMGSKAQLRAASREVLQDAPYPAAEGCMLGSIPIPNVQPSSDSEEELLPSSPDIWWQNKMNWPEIVPGEV